MPIFPLIVLLLSGCASHIPLDIRNAPTPSAATIDAAAFKKRPARWGRR